MSRLRNARDSQTSYSARQNCVEVRLNEAGGVDVRDTQNREGHRLHDLSV